MTFFLANEAAKTGDGNSDDEWLADGWRSFRLGPRKTTRLGRKLTGSHRLNQFKKATTHHTPFGLRQRLFQLESLGLG